jgi:YaiO family outer membrane protein
MKPFLILSILVFTFSGMIWGQESHEPYADPESGFDLMRSHAEHGRTGQAKELGYRILEQEPDYHDVSLYLVRVHGWEGSYDSAYALLDEVILKEPGLLEAYVTGVDIAYWDNDWVRLQAYAEKALELEPGLSEVEEKIQLARNQRLLSRQVPEIYFHYYYDHFGVPYVRNWHMLTAGGTIPLQSVTLMPYLNAGYHAGGATPSTDLQMNLDGYVTLGKKNYALVGYGFSPDGELNYLPGHRGVGEIWQALPAGFSISAGFRFFYWEESFIFATISGEKYLGDYWFSLRNYLFFKEVGPSASFYLTVRRYFGDIFNYLSLTAGYGTAPDEPLLVVSDLERLNAFSFRVELYRQVTERVRLGGMAGYAYEEYTDREFRHRFDFRLGTFIRLGKW